MKQCPACGANNSSDQPSCSICGAPLSQVADAGAARTLFGMPALKFGKDEEDDAPAPTPAPAPAPAPASRSASGPGTRPGFRALDAVELDGSVGSLNIRTLDRSSSPAPSAAAEVDELRSTQFGAPSPFKAGQLPPLGTGDPDFEGDLASEPPAPEPTPAIESTRMGMPVFNAAAAKAGGATAGAGQSSVEPTPLPEPEKQENYRTLVGPPLPLAEAARARDAARARQAAEQQPAEPEKQENYRTLVGPPVPIAEAARARDEARARRAAEQAAQSEARGPSIIVDDGLEQGDEGGQPSVIVDEPVTPRATGSNIPARQVKPTGASEVGRTSRDAERAAASRFAAAMDTDERTAMVVTVPERGYGWLVFLVLIVAGIALALWLTRDAHAFEARLDGVELTPGAERMTLTAAVVADRPVKVTLDGLDTPPTLVDQRAEVAFDLPLAEVTPGQKVLSLTVATEEGSAALPVELTVWAIARLAEVKAVGQPVPVTVDARPGWAPSGSFRPLDAARGRYAAALDPTPALAQVDAPGGLTGTLATSVVLHSEGDAQKTFELTVEVPLPRTPLVVTAPARAWRRDAETVVVAGRTAPGARVTVAGAATDADAGGLFRVEAPLGGAREQNLEVVADGPGARPTVQIVSVERLSPAEGVAQATALRAQQSERLGAVGRTPPYARWGSDAEALRGRAVAFEGRLVAIERGVERADDREAQADRAVVATCDTAEHCPVWVTTHSPILVDVGQRVTVSGTLAGTETWRATDRFVTAPRVEGALLAP